MLINIFIFDIFCCFEWMFSYLLIRCQFSKNEKSEGDNSLQEWWLILCFFDFGYLYFDGRPVIVSRKVVVSEYHLILEEQWWFAENWPSVTLLISLIHNQLGFDLAFGCQCNQTCIHYFCACCQCLGIKIGHVQITHFWMSLTYIYNGHVK